jgi:SAM-dependent methyltransferase
MLKSMVKTIIPASYHKHISNAIRVSTSVLYAGNRFECPVCGGTFRRFRPYGGTVPVIREKEILGMGFRANSACPRCNSRERTRMTALYVGRLLRERQGLALRVLHFAPEKSLQEYLLKHRNVQYLSGDLCPGAAMVVMDITHIQYPQSSFDLIICNHVLEHVPDDAKAMSELRRVLAPDGIALITVPFSLKLDRTYEDFSITDEDRRLRLFGQADHCRIYGADFVDRLTAAGLKARSFRAAELFSSEEVSQHSLMEEEPLFLCGKSNGT